MQRGFAPIPVALLIVAAIVLLGGAYYWGKSSTNTSSELISTPTAQPVATQPAASVKPAESTTPVQNLKKIPIVSSEGWQTINKDGVTFKIPSGARYEDLQNGAGLIYWTADSYLPSRIAVRDYKGGSRREEFYNGTTPDCHEIYEEAMFGNVKALQIAIDGGWCQGGGGGIVTVAGSKLVIYYDLGYDLETKKISRYDKRDTTISTIKTQ